MKQKLRGMFSGRENDSSKYDYGHVLVIGGSKGMSGAPVLAARAGMRSGAGLVTCAVPSGVYDIVATQLVEVMSLALETKTKDFFDSSSVDFILDFIEKRKIDSVVIGPGLGREAETIKFVKDIVKNVEVPLVIDADGLYAFSGGKGFVIPELRRKAPLVITPHYKEMSRLIGETTEFIIDNKEDVCRNIAKSSDLLCVLKGFESIVSDGDKIFKNPSGNPGMATAGAGDVLAGILGAFLAGNKVCHSQNFSEILGIHDVTIFNIVSAAVYLHGVSGDLTRDKIGEISLIASDIIENIPEAIKRIKT